MTSVRVMEISNILLRLKEVLHPIENGSKILRWKFPQKALKEEKKKMNKEEVMEFNRK